jgi:hypothetical protein
VNTPTLVVSLVIAAVLVIVVVVIFRAMVRGWQRRADLQGTIIGALPPLPDTVGAPVIAEMTGLYVGSTLMPDKLERVAADGLGDRAKAALTRYPEGIMLKRSGARPLWIPDDSILAIRTERFAVGKVAAHDGILAIRWKLPSGAEVDTGFRGDDRRKYADWTGQQN